MKLKWASILSACFLMFTTITMVYASPEAPINIIFFNHSYDDESKALQDLEALEEFIQEIYQTGSSGANPFDFTSIPDNRKEVNILPVLGIAGTGRGEWYDYALQWLNQAELGRDAENLVLAALRTVTGRDYTSREVFVREGLTIAEWLNFVKSISNIVKLGTKAPIAERMSRADFNNFADDVNSLKQDALSVQNKMQSFLSKIVDRDDENYKRAVDKVNRDRECLIALSVGQGDTELRDLRESYGIDPFEFGQRFKALQSTTPPSTVFPLALVNSFQELIATNSSKAYYQNIFRELFNELKNICGLRITSDDILIEDTFFPNNPVLQIFDILLSWDGYAEFPVTYTSITRVCGTPPVIFFGGGCLDRYEITLENETKPLIVEGVGYCGGDTALVYENGWRDVLEIFLTDSRGVETNSILVTNLCRPF